MINPFNLLLDQQEQLESGADLQLATVAAVTAEGLSLIPDGETEATQKKYKYMTSAYEDPAAGDRVVVMRLSGTYVVLGRIGTSTPASDKYVRRSGDTMTGLLNIERTMPGVIGKVTNRASEDTAEANANSYGFRIVDKNNNPVAVYTDRYETSGENGALIGGYRMVDGTLYGNILRILITPAGIPVVYVTSPAAWRKALQIGSSTGAFPLTVEQGGTGNTSVDSTPTAGSTKMVTSGGVKSALDGKVSDTGDTMTGELNLKSTTHTIGTAPASTTSDRRIYFKDLAGTIFGKLQSVFTAANAIGMQIGAQRTVNGTMVENNVSLYVNADGTRSVSFTEPAKWRNALGLGTNGALPLTIAQGGSGNTGIVSTTTIASIITAATGFSITSAQFYSWGKVAMFVIAAKATADASTSGWHTIGNLVSGKRPAGSQIIRDLGGVSSVIYSDGRLNGYGSFNSGRTFEFTAIYLLP